MEANVDARRWLDELQAHLVRQRLPPRYVARLVAEMSDHFHDFLEDRMSTDAKDLRGFADHLGKPRDIATAAASEFRGRTFSGRHPLVAFLALPIVTVPLLWAAIVIVLLLGTKALGIDSGGANLGGPLSAWLTANMHPISFSILVVPAATAAFVFCRLACRAGLGWKWSVLACMVVALLSGLAWLNIVLPTVGAKGQITFGLGVALHPSIFQFARFAVPLAIGLWTIWRQSKRSTALTC
jgi:hypothetical protein